MVQLQRYLDAELLLSNTYERRFGDEHVHATRAH